ncbi:MAG: bifunctional pyr operon transcriptional regulator/uracil phosphoribosyltransferase PyrR [Deltaproteobacteria bacterium]|nr:bifunctional pyr operon transcriptional regulator/uracil phosphoribosyltransferase PyrR [Deltaproteobacteria bacterium]
MSNSSESRGGKKPPAHWKLIVNQETIARCITRISYEILEKRGNIKNLAIVGIRTGGEHVARRIHKQIEKIENTTVPFGVIDITLYRDDLAHVAQPLIKGTDLPFAIENARIVLVDDILYTGRTVRAALDAIIDFGRPGCVEFAVVADRGHRELPIRADYVGKNLPTQRDEFVRIKFVEDGYAEDGVYIFHKDKGKTKEQRRG